MYKFDLLKFARMTNFWYPQMIHFGSFFYWFVEYLCSVPVWLWLCLSHPLVLSYFNFMYFKAIPLVVRICRIYFTSELNSLWGCSIFDSSLQLTCGPSRIPAWILTWFRGFSLLYGAWIPTFVSIDTEVVEIFIQLFFSLPSSFQINKIPQCGKQHQTFQVSGPPKFPCFSPSYHHWLPTSGLLHNSFSILFCSLSGKELGKAEDPGSIPGLGRSPREENGNPLQ